MLQPDSNMMFEATSTLVKASLCQRPCFQLGLMYEQLTIDCNVINCVLKSISCLFNTHMYITSITYFDATHIAIVVLMFLLILLRCQTTFQTLELKYDLSCTLLFSFRLITNLNIIKNLNVTCFQSDITNYYSLKYAVYCN